MSDSKSKTSATKGLKRGRCDYLSEGADAPLRDCRDLWAATTTIDCANKGCIPCAYKICCFDVALDTAFCKKVPNQRPEMCPRSCLSVGNEGTLGYIRKMKVLTVGDGDFSFSLALARLGVVLTATSYESRATLENVYPDIQQTLIEMKRLGATILFQVDATNLARTLPKKYYERIVWNFPCSAIAKGQDGQNKEMDWNKELVRRFVANARDYAAINCQIHINHKTKPPFNHWRIEDVALEMCQDDDRPVYHIGRVIMDRCLFPPYIPRKALDRKSFPVHDACTFVFALEKNESILSTGLSRVTTKLLQHIRITHLNTTISKSQRQKK